MNMFADPYILDPTYTPYPTDDIWAEKLKPIPNPLMPGQGFDYGEGSCLMTFSDLQIYKKENELNENCIWSVIESDGFDKSESEETSSDLFISHGFHYVNVLGYLVTEKSPDLPFCEDIPVV